jgi:hypothetical protein
MLFFKSQWFVNIFNLDTPPSAAEEILLGALIIFIEVRALCRPT